jgi:hypothetical protein
MTRNVRAVAVSPLSKKSHMGGNFVALDAEGMDLPEPPYRLDKDGSRKYTPRPMQLKHKKNENYQDPIFISFGFGYDVGQIVKDMSYEKRWELNAGKAWAKRDNRLPDDLMHCPVLYKGFALTTCIPGKILTIFRLKDPANPFYYDGKGVKHVSYRQRICIYDTFGFFQMAFTGALEGFPNALNKDEFDLVVANKAKRGRFKPEDIEEITGYTTLELKVLVNMLDTIRTSLETARARRKLSDS